MPSPTYSQNKSSAYKWNSKNHDRVCLYRLRSYYKSKIADKEWASIKYVFLDILRDDNVIENE